MFDRANPTGWVQGDKLTPAQINQIDVDQSRAIDGTGGGIYTPTAKIQIQGSAGVEVGGTGPAAWVQLSSRLVTISHSFSLALVNPNVGPSSNVPSGAIVPSDQSSIIDGQTVYTPCVQSAQNATTQAQASWFLLEFLRPPDGAALASVTLTVAGQGVFPGGFTANYAMVKWDYSQFIPIGQLVIVDDHTLANWTSQRPQTGFGNLSLSLVDISSFHYGVLVFNPFAPSSAGCSIRIYDVSATYSVTSHRF